MQHIQGPHRAPCAMLMEIYISVLKERKKMLVCGSREHQLLEIYEKLEKRGWSWYTII